MTLNTELWNAKNSPTQTIDIDGTRFAYREFGPNTGVPVVFLHHFTAVLDDWDPRVIDGIGSERRVITFDNRGVGGSGGRTPTTVSAMADDAIAFIRALGLKQVDLMGFSLGGFVSQMIVTKQPTLVRRIILAGTGPAGGVGVGKITPTLLSDMLHGLLTLKDPKRYLFFTRTAHGKAAATDFMNRLEERTEGRVNPTSPWGVAAQIVAIRRWGAQDPMDLASIEHPVLVANGEDDRMLPTRSSFDLAHRLPNASLRIYPDAGHGGVFQYHERFVPQVLEFLR
ncbi:alpha/beta fold hydrolase [Rhodococcus opacus]|uniref:alpha/beta fold hydrolase n=1 Tax=Rhodococcus opacus TaxID=37919 RepID=UPI000EAA1FF0|nr:alpha/beta hydrolase [Rhodococcus opacus]QZS52544.1 alpha/beta hydrolase [Rhodococcus opacus]RKM64907.1 alpha/beta hydrolase [Rhodococcus opacus]